METNQSDIILNFIKYYKQNLDLRYIIIGAIGQVGQADKIREQIAKNHKSDSLIFAGIISRWYEFNDDKKLAIYDKLSDDINNKIKSQILTLQLLLAAQADALKNNKPTALYDRGVNMHIALVQNSLGLIALIEMINDSMQSQKSAVKQDSAELSELLDWSKNFIALPRAAAQKLKNKAKL